MFRPQNKGIEKILWSLGLPPEDRPLPESWTAEWQKELDVELAHTWADRCITTAKAEGVGVSK